MQIEPGKVCLRRPMAEPFFWTKLAKCRQPLRPNCFASW